MKKRHDHYFNKAKKDNYAARSIYKLEEAQKKYKFINSKDNVIDIGCSPGSWSQYLLEHIIKTGFVTGIDILPATFSHPKFNFIEKDIKEITIDDIGDTVFDVAVSDAMPNTTSDKETNHFRSIALAYTITNFVILYLKEDGFFFIKVYDGRDLTEYKKYLKQYFNSIDVFKPKSSRDESREIYIFCKSFIKN